MNILFFFFRVLLRARYRVVITGQEHLSPDTPIVLFPNHPALIDPIILFSFLGKYKILSPVVTETYYHTPGLEPLLKKVGAVPVGDIARGGTIEDVKKAFIGIQEALKSEKNILLYPSGHIYVQPFEHIVGKKMGYEVISGLPEYTRVICVRTKGLWGSMWGKAYTGESPVLSKLVISSILMLFANFFFFMPKREVHLHIEDKTDDIKNWYKEGMDTFNSKLQDYYNEGGNESCRFIKHYFWKNDIIGKKEPEMITGSIKEIESTSSLAREDISDAVYEKVITRIATIKKIPKESIIYTTNLILDLHADSLDMAEIKSAIQSDFPGSSNPPIPTLKTIGDFCTMAIGKSRSTEAIQLCHFPIVETGGISLNIHPEKDTILKAIERICRADSESPFLYDSALGEVKRGDFLLKSYVIGEYLKKYTPTHMGIMLPALGATSLLLTGTYIAGKIPVMLNWTVGEKSFIHCMNFAKLETILTSRRFYEKITTPWLSQFESKMLFIEDIIGDISLMTKILAAAKMKLRIHGASHSTAVLLFTSGSESLPKAVPLTHTNILSDIVGALELVPFKKHETIVGFLPPFHSFGFTINTIFPLIAPIQAGYTPDPNDARTIVEFMKHIHATIIPATPTFLRMILAAGDTFDTLRYAFVGAEKCSDEVFALFKEKCPQGVILEGYGITECSPIVTVNPLDSQKKGSAGKFLPSLTPMIRSLDGKEALESSKEGMIYVTGPSIFLGYLDSSIESPFETYDGKKWYKTGDLGYIDGDGFLFITGRLKRFVKIAGEMISLPFIENILLEQYGNPEMTTLALEAKEENGVVTIVAFTTFETNPEELNTYIHTHGASNLVKISRVERIHSIPVLGTGKTDYKILKSMI